MLPHLGSLAAMLRLLASLVVPLALSPLTHAQSTAGPVDELRARLDELARVEGLDPSVARPVTLGRAALNRAAARATQGDRDGATRAEAIARAALELAEARLRVLRERALLRAAEARNSAGKADIERAEQAIARERARLAELQPPEKKP